MVWISLTKITDKMAHFGKSAKVLKESFLFWAQPLGHHVGPHATSILHIYTKHLGRVLSWYKTGPRLTLNLRGSSSVRLINNTPGI